MDAVSKKMQELNIDITKINTSLEGIKKHSDEVELDMLEGESVADLESELAKLNKQLEDLSKELEKVEEQKSYVDVVR